MKLELIKKYFDPQTILDIGAHRGDFYLLAKYLFPQAYFFLIEGNPECDSYLKQLGPRYLIRILGKEKGKAIFYKTKENPLSSGVSLYKEVTPHFCDDNLIKEEVNVHTIDTIFEEADFDLIKIDTQGSELDILTGGQRIAKKAKGILLEISLQKYNEGAPLYNEVVNFMDSFGFIEKECLEENKTTTPYNLNIHQKDVLFINKNIL